ncbi:DsbA family protein [Deinococcus sp. Marseille-Q6407]|uniref:DsbA family oxidoreductase n=1 Tax=Deinococcus sp. Marseille-Q6407 TaxID=2969223 RepID=UPI0021BE77E7|nr:DsbA family protein [Deinococcus sp. Marseille-Q6407]
MHSIYFDFLCPYAWRGLELATALGGPQGFVPRHFSLLEGNHRDNTQELHWRLTDQDPRAQGEDSFLKAQHASLNAFLSAQAARRQGPATEWNYSLVLFRLHHEQGQPLEEATFQQAAQLAEELDQAAWQQARQEISGLQAALRADLDTAAGIGVQGTPTFVLESGEAAYFRFEELTRDPAEAKRRWDLYTAVLRDPARIGTIKRARNRPA